ncbi:uncharacterized protein DUF802 [Paraburkholderia sp. BL23I1N1]|uniref:DUF802 domain-containing protein n=1 Tax=Paraburkholderia sp. BL23I1N1 TaxID=1938802 RepID=UPI000E7628F6|nr:DUF802 domain-containing protein [Paraburkholderia sp. BL23I1N1]RKE37577.1 uncharacterized protein DUF802 [Paraburkholderia sp. BL23I1N1]
MSRYLNLVVFLAGLAAVCWIGAGYVGSNTLALAVTMLIAMCYVAGALELQRYGQATSTLAQAVAGLSAPPPSLGAWLDPLHPSLRNAVRLRVEGERVAMPGPALTPYLVGLLVLLGMLGTLLGMVATLRGTGMALESATDLQAIRDSLAAPVKGLGFAFGTSIAGVATSAMLGLLSALSRRERIHAAQMLDVKIATTLRIYSQTHQREESFKLLQRQAEVMPTLVDRLQAMMAAIEQQSLASNERQIASQDAFHSKAEAAYTRLATSVEQSLKESVAESTRAANAALRPVMEATMAGLARETASLHDTVTQAVQRQLDGLSTGFEATTTTVADIWNRALEGQQRTSEALTQHLGASLDRFTETFEQRSAGLLDGVSARLDATAESVSAAWNEALSRQEHVGEKLAGHNQQALAAAVATFEQHSASLLRTVGQSHTDLQTELAARDQQRLAVWTDTLGSMATTLSQEWEQAGTRTASRQQEISDTLAQTARDISAQTQAHASNTIAEIDRLVQAAAEAPKAAANLQAELAARDQQRLAAWTETLGSMATTLSQEWEQAGTRTASQQQEICDTLAQTARDIAAQTQAHASSTIAEIGQLVQAASEAPKAAAEVVAELRQKLSDSMVRDTAMLDERSRLLATLETLLDAVNHASTEQRSAVDALVATSADLLDRVGTRFTDKVELETGKLGAIAAQVTGSAVEVASLGEAFGAAVQLFGESNSTLVTHLQRIEAALDKSLARSDEQLAYYVAQAREVIDLSMMSQKQIVEDLQHLAGKRASVGVEAA